MRCFTMTATGFYFNYISDLLQSVPVFNLLLSTGSFRCAPDMSKVSVNRLERHRPGSSKRSPCLRLGRHFATVAGRSAFCPLNIPFYFKHIEFIHQMLFLARAMLLVFMEYKTKIFRSGGLPRDVRHRLFSLEKPNSACL